MIKKSAIGAGVLILVLLAALVAVRLVTGRSLGLRSFAAEKASFAVNTLKAVQSNREVTANNQGGFTNIIFLHLSTGANLIEQGGVRELFSQAGYNFWDHGYNEQGLRDPTGKHTGYNYSVPHDNTNPDGLAAIFSQPVYDLPLNTFSALMQHEVIIFKSCFPVSGIKSDAQLEMYKAWYLGMRDVMDDHPNRIFIVLSPPPLNPAETEAEEAIRARAFANWLKSPEYLAGHPNIFTFDLFDQLAESNLNLADANMLRSDYREGSDSHPNRLANESLAPVFVRSVIAALEEYQDR